MVRLEKRILYRLNFSLTFSCQVAFSCLIPAPSIGVSVSQLAGELFSSIKSSKISGEMLYFAFVELSDVAENLDSLLILPLV